MTPRRRRATTAIAFFLFAAVVTVAAHYGLQLAAVGTAFTAKTLCSGVFVSQREPASILDTDLSAHVHPILRWIGATTDRSGHAVTANLFGLAERKAVYREGLGCVVLAQDRGVDRAAASAVEAAPGFAERSTVRDDLRIASEPSPDIDAAQLRSALHWAFSDPDPTLPRNTRAVLVVHDGKVVAEHYADGFTQDTPLIGWSMTKSVVNALVGVLVGEGKLSLETPAAVPEWRGAGDPRSRITVANLLHMTSGLQFDEDYSNPLADVTYMLFGVSGAADYAVAKPLRAEPGTRWRYSSGTTNALTHAIRNVLGEADYTTFPRDALFDRIGMSSAVLETDATGTFVGSSFMYATARDWARFGLLYLQDGLWSGERILPEGWVGFSRSPAPAAPDGKFGAHFWLRIPEEFRCGENTADLPADAFHAVGYAGQFVTIVPSRKLVLVRLGLTHYPCGWDHQKFLALVLDAFTGERRAQLPTADATSSPTP